MTVSERPSPASQLRPRLCVVVAGMHRSGTSAVTRVVNLLGANVAHELLPAKAGDNDRGYWESSAVVAIHDQLLRALGSAFDDPSPLPERWLDSSFARDAQRRLADEILRDFGSSRLFVVKDPRIARLLPLWLELLDELAIEPIVVIPVRNPLEVAASLKRRDEYSVPYQAQSMLLYVRSYLATELASRGRRRLFVRYDQLLSDWQQFATKLRKIVGSHFPRPSADNVTEIGNFLTSDLHRNRASREQLAQSPEIAATVVEIFDRMAEAADTGDEISLRRSFDRLRETTTEATKLFQGLVLAERDKAQTQLFRLSQDHGASEARAAGENARLQAEPARLQNELGAAWTHAAELEAAVAAKATEAARLDGELAAIRSRATELESELETRSSQLGAVRKQMAELESELETRSGKLDTARRQMRELEGVAETRSAEAVRLSSELAAARHRAAQSAHVSEARRKELDAIKLSKIWRMTRPLQSIGAKWPWIARQGRRCLQLVWWTSTLQLGLVRHRLQTWSDLHVIEASGLFDRQYYLEHYPDVGASGVDPVLHYLQYGALEGRIPTPVFDGNLYLERNSDVRRSGANPLVHYLRHGGLEGRDPNPWFDSDWYLERNPDVRKAGMNPLVHYLLHGAKEGRDPSPLFDIDRYLKGNVDIREAGVNPLGHFWRSGTAGGRQPAPQPHEAIQVKVAPSIRPAAQADDRIDASIRRFLLSHTESHLTYRPLISILMPTYNTPPIFLEAAVRSVIQQVYQCWELRIVDDGSTDHATLEALNLIERWDARIHVTKTPNNRGIARATNDAMARARGEFIAMLDHDDELTLDALLEVVGVLNEDPATDAIYTDQDYVSPEGVMDGHLLKPDWSPERFRGVMYIGHLLTVRRTLAINIGGFNSRFDFVQDFEFMLRLGERTRNIRHVPKVLYHWRRAPQSVAGGGKVEKGIESLQAAAVQAHLDRVGISGTAKPNSSHPHRAVIEPANTSIPPLDVLIVGRKSGFAQSSIREAFARTADSRSEVWTTEDLAAQVVVGKKKRVITGTALSEAALVSRVLLEGKHDFVLVVSADLTLEPEAWINWLARPMQEPDVACVCPVVCSADGRVAHAGLVIERDGHPRSALSGSDPAGDGYAGSMSCAREVSAAWGEIVLLRRAAVLSVLSTDAVFWTSDFLIADLTLRCTKEGLRTICVPQVRARRSRQVKVDEQRQLDELLFCDVWGEEAGRGESFHNPTFSSAEKYD